MNFGDGALPLVVGTVLALVALTLVLSPLLGDGTDAKPTPRPAKRSQRDQDEEQQGSAVAALREIEFDRATGKLSDEDYAELKARYTREALAELRATEGATAGAALASSDTTSSLALDPVEAAIQRARVRQQACGACGPRPEPDALYCSSCGRYLPGACGRCGASVDVAGSRFCSGCGEQLAAA